MVRRLNKKAGMELSVNAIIMIIIAVIVMGFLITFISGAFTDISRSFNEQIASEREPPVATLSKPITVSKEKVLASPGESVAFKVGYFNAHQTTKATNVKPTVTCTGLTGLAFETNAKSVEPRSEEVFGGILRVPSATPGTYLCAVDVTGTFGTGIDPSVVDLTLEID